MKLVLIVIKSAYISSCCTIPLPISTNKYLEDIYENYWNHDNSGESGVRKKRVGHTKHFTVHFHTGTIPQFMY